MDKLRDFFRTVKRIHFWLICSLVTVLSLVFWFLSVGKLAKETKSNKSRIEELFSQVSGVQRKPLIANNNVATEMDKVIEQRRLEIKEAWDEKWKQQNSEEVGILTWPEELGATFNRKIGWLRPIEKYEFPLPDNIDGREVELRINERENYRDYIYAELPKLAESIGAEWKIGRQRPTTGPMVQNQTTVITQSIVEWNPQNQQELMAAHFTWGANAGGTTGYSEGGPARRRTGRGRSSRHVADSLYARGSLDPPRIDEGHRGHECRRKNSI